MWKNIIIFEKSKTSQEYDYATGCLLEYPSCKEYFKVIVIDLC